MGLFEQALVPFQDAESAVRALAPFLAPVLPARTSNGRGSGERLLGAATPAQARLGSGVEPYGYSRSLAGGRLSQDTSTRFPGLSYIAPPEDAEASWRMYRLDEHALLKQTPSQLIQILCDISPDVSRALFDYNVLSNPSWTLEVTRTRDSRRRYQKGYDALMNFMEVLDVNYGSLDVMFDRMFTASFLRGAFFSELVLNDELEPIDIALPDPITARFKKVKAPPWGEKWRLGQWQGGEWVDLADRQTVIYLPVHPMPASPYGRSLVAPALFTVIFMTGLLHDLRRVIVQQGYPRMDLEVKLELLKQMMPTELENDPKKLKAWVDGIVQEIKDIYEMLQPDDAYVHTNVLEVKKPQGTMGGGAGSLSMVGDMISMLERMIARALKTMPIMMGISDSISESNANRQWEIMAAGIRKLQKLGSRMLERQFMLALQAMGLPAYVQFSFTEFRAAEALRDQQVQTLKNTNAAFQEMMGWIDHDEAANNAVGHDAASPEPIQMPAGIQSPVKGGVVNDAQTTPESETGRATETDGERIPRILDWMRSTSDVVKRAS